MALTSDASQVVFAAHGRLLRAISDETRQHYQGLAQAARAMRIQKRISPRSAKKLVQLDLVAAWIRHVTRPGCDTLLDTVHRELQASAQQQERSDEQSPKFKKFQGDKSVKQRDTEHKTKQGQVAKQGSEQQQVEQKEHKLKTRSEGDRSAFVVDQAKELAAKQEYAPFKVEPKGGGGLGGQEHRCQGSS